MLSRHSRRHARTPRDDTYVRGFSLVMRRAAALSVLALAIAITPTTSTSAALAMTPERSTASCSPGVPEKHCLTAMYVYNFVVSHGYAAPPSLKGNLPYRDDFGQLPAGGDYREYRLYRTPGSEERLVIDRNNPEGNSWFTENHYIDFVQFYLTL
jgi:hypothetical protein